jgi:hypothetical protein
LLSIKNWYGTVPSDITGVAVIVNVRAIRESFAPQVAAGLTDARRCEGLIAGYSREGTGAPSTRMSAINSPFLSATAMTPRFSAA